MLFVYNFSEYFQSLEYSAVRFRKMFVAFPQLLYGDFRKVLKDFVIRRQLFGVMGGVIVGETLLTL